METNRKNFIMGKVYVTSDYHFNHKDIIQYENRPFKNIDKMNESIIKNHNEIVNDDDICYNLGDFYFRGGYQAGNIHYWDFLKQLNGRHVIIRGNHAKSNKIVDIIQSADAHAGGLKISMLHDPMYATSKNDLILCGHVHSAWLMTELHENNKIVPIINCGIDVWNYRPIAFTDLFNLYMKWKDGKITVPIFDKKALKKVREERKKQRQGETS